MYSVKPGRGPSAAGVAGAIFAAIFGVIWTFLASSMGAPPLFVLFGILFVVFAIVGGLVNLYNATSSNRFSTMDIVPSNIEPDPMENLIGLGREREETLTSDEERDQEQELSATRYCVNCGNGLAAQFRFCPRCGTRAQPPA